MLLPVHSVPRFRQQSKGLPHFRDVQSIIPRDPMVFKIVFRCGKVQIQAAEFPVFIVSEVAVEAYAHAGIEDAGIVLCFGDVPVRPAAAPCAAVAVGKALGAIIQRRVKQFLKRIQINRFVILAVPVPQLPRAASSSMRGTPAASARPEQPQIQTPPSCEVTSRSG